ncbi:MAG: PadR family transcriptional regulator [Gemmatimonadales bacterium]
MSDPRTDLVQGTLELLVLKTLAIEPMHGWGIAQRIQLLSREVFLVPQGSLYPALVRMKRRGLLKTHWRMTAANRRARYYELTTAGKRQLGVERDNWLRASSAVNLILAAEGLAGAAGGGGGGA